MEWNRGDSLRVWNRELGYVLKPSVIPMGIKPGFEARKDSPQFQVINSMSRRVKTLAYFYMKQGLLCLGIIWSGGLLTASVFKVVDLGTNRDFFLGVFGGCTTGLGLCKTTNQNNNGSTSRVSKESSYDSGHLEKDENGFY